MDMCIDLLKILYYTSILVDQSRFSHALGESYWDKALGATMVASPVKQGSHSQRTERYIVFCIAVYCTTVAIFNVYLGGPCVDLMGMNY